MPALGFVLLIFVTAVDTCLRYDDVVCFWED